MLLQEERRENSKRAFCDVRLVQSDDRQDGEFGLRTIKILIICCCAFLLLMPPDYLICVMIIFFSCFICLLYVSLPDSLSLCCCNVNFPSGINKVLY